MSSRATPAFPPPHFNDPDRRRFLKLVAAGMVSGLLPAATGFWSARAFSRDAIDDTSHGIDALFCAFDNPPSEAGPGVYWYWLGGAVTRKGLTADLEALKEVGISRAMIFSIGTSGDHPLVSPPADALTPTWWTMIEHAVNEARRVGIQLSMNICDGWATASGPRITPELSMQRLVWSRTRTEGGRLLTLPLPRPSEIRHDYYRDIATLAFQVPASWNQDSLSRRPQVTSNLPIADIAKLLDPDNAEQVLDTQREGWIQFVFGTPFTLRSVTIRTAQATSGYAPGVYRAPNSLEVQASDDGMRFLQVARLHYPHHGWQADMTTLTHAIPPTTARYFRFIYQPESPLPYHENQDFGQDDHFKLSSIVLSSMPHVDLLPVKAGLQWGWGPRSTSHDIPDHDCIALDAVVDVSGHMDQDGTLHWQAPSGNWHILRIGYTTTGSENSAAGLGKGLEYDRFNADAARLQFNKWFGEVLERVGPGNAGKILHVVHVDSWEAGCQNWSPVFEDGFQRLRGYGLRPYLLAMTGVPVVSAEVTERVLFDVRRTISDLTHENFFATVAELAHAHGCIFSAEPASPTFPVDGLEYARYADFPMGEFWFRSPRNDKPTDIKDAISGGHTYGRQLIGAEAFTDVLIRWDEHPFLFKAQGDHNYCLGINRFMLHVYAAQPWLDRAPGMTLNGIGSFFDRTQTWWKPGRAWIDYLRRTQALLQQGTNVCDVCYFIGENVPARSLLPSRLFPVLPDGYQYDCINRDVLLRLSRVEDGTLVLDSGARYRVLVLPDTPRMSVELAARIRDLVAAGACVVGPRPETTPGLQGGDDARATVHAIGQRIWADIDGLRATSNRYGKGQVIWGEPLETVLQGLRLRPDLEVVHTSMPALSIEWNHRRGPDWDIYFLSNQCHQHVQTMIRFRISGRTPVRLNPDQASRQALAAWHDDGTAISLPLDFDPAGSCFVLFTSSGRATDAVRWESGNTSTLMLQPGQTRPDAWATAPGRWILRNDSGHDLQYEQQTQPPHFTLPGPWHLTFAQRLPHRKQLTLPQPSSWTEQPNPDIRYYSGTAEYITTFDLPDCMLTSGQRLFLDLGEVADMAQVDINGHDLGVLWKPPFRVEISGFVRAKDNRLHLSVTNTWRNRMIGDYGRPPSKRVAFVVPTIRKGRPWLPGGPGATLSPAGILGPVCITSAVPLTPR